MENADKLLGRVDQWLDGLEGIVREYGTFAFQQTVDTIQTHGLVTLVSGAAFLLLLLVSIIFLFRGIGIVNTEANTQKEDAVGFGMCVVSVICAVMGLAGTLDRLIDVDAWIEATRPLGALTTRLLM